MRAALLPRQLVARFFPARAGTAGHQVLLRHGVRFIPERAGNARVTVKSGLQRPNGRWTRRLDATQGAFPGAAMERYPCRTHVHAAPPGTVPSSTADSPANLRDHHKIPDPRFQSGPPAGEAATQGAAPAAALSPATL